MKNSGAIFAGILAVVIWAAIPSLVKIGSGPENFIQFLVLRFALALVFFVHVVPALWRKASGIEPWRFIALGSVLAANYYFQTVAMQRLPASWYIVIFSLNPILALIALRLQLSRQLITATLVSAVGTLLFVQSSDLSALMNVWTFACLVLGMLTWVLYTILIAGFQKTYSDFEATALTQIVAFISLSLLWGTHGFPSVAWSAVHWPSVLILGLSTPLAYFGFNYCLRRVPAFCVVSQYLEPVVGVALGVVLFKEQLSAVQMCGALAIVIGTSRMTK